MQVNLTTYQAPLTLSLIQLLLVYMAAFQTYQHRSSRLKRQYMT